MNQQLANWRMSVNTHIEQRVLLSCSGCESLDFSPGSFDCGNLTPLDGIHLGQYGLRMGERLIVTGHNLLHPWPSRWGYRGCKNLCPLTVGSGSGNTYRSEIHHLIMVQMTDSVNIGA